MKMPVAVFRPRTRRQVVPMRMTVVYRRDPAHRMDMTGRVWRLAGHTREDMIVARVLCRQSDKAVPMHSVRQKNHPVVLYAPEKRGVTAAIPRRRACSRAKVRAVFARRSVFSARRASICA
jgi:hypothetical protein